MRISDVKPGDPITAQHYNQLVMGFNHLIGGDGLGRNKRDLWVGEVKDTSIAAMSNDSTPAPGIGDVYIVELDYSTPAAPEITAMTAEVEVLNLGPKVLDGDFVLVGRDGATGRYCIVKSLMATLGWGQLSADCTGGPPAVDGIVWLNGYQPVTSLSTSDTLNPFGMEGDDNGDVIVMWDSGNGKWMAVQMECPA